MFSAGLGPETYAQASPISRRGVNARTLLPRRRDVCEASQFFLYAYGGGESQDDGWVRTFFLQKNLDG